MKKKLIPAYVRFIFWNFFILLLFLWVLRIIFWQFSISLGDDVPYQDVKNALLIGARFDTRLALITTFPLHFYILIIGNSYFRNKWYHRLAGNYMAITYIIISLFYLYDFGYFSYIGSRLDASVMRFANNPWISLKMLWQNYHVIWGLIGLVIFYTFVYKFTFKLYKKNKPKNFIPSKVQKIVFAILTVLAISGGIYNSTSHYPLRWSQAIFSKHHDVNQLALNPVLFFFDSFKFRKSGFEEEKTKSYYPTMSHYLKVDRIDQKNLNFERKIKLKHTDNKPNIVIVMLESVGAPVLGHYGNPMQGTPVMDSLMQHSLAFENHFVHRVGTARSVYASITGLPDVMDIKTASRNPKAINQRTVVNQFDAYGKYYFLGGSANWANIRAVFNANIDDLIIYEEGSYPKEERDDVWGIDDYKLFKEADNVLRDLNKKDKPFFAYIQTATNHRPFTVPDQLESFKALQEDDVDMKKLDASGFINIEQFNALRYLDFNIKKFLERAKASGYYDNTIFVFYGDHNTSTRPYKHMKRNEYDLGMGQLHTPLIIHAPKLVQDTIIQKPVGLIDLMPTLAHASQGMDSYTNYTLGKNQLDNTESYAFYYHNQFGGMGLNIVSDKYLYAVSRDDLSKKKLYALDDEKLHNLATEKPELTKKLDSLAQGFYESTRYLYYNNKK